MAKGKKICAKCGKAAGPRTLVCSECKTKFSVKSKQPKTYDSIGQGRKRCGSCNAVCGAKCRKCPGCSAPFRTRSTAPVNLVEDWRVLEPGEYIKTIKGSGPYWPAKDEDSEKVSMGYYGVFKVHGVGKDGIHAYPEGRGECGHCFIYMGEECTTESGLIRVSHKIVKVRKKQRND